MSLDTNTTIRRCHLFVNAFRLCGCFVHGNVATPSKGVNTWSSNGESPALDGITFDLTWDSSVQNAPVTFKSAVLRAFQNLSSYVNSPVTVNLSIGYGEVNSAALGANNLGETISELNNLSYVSVRDAVARSVKSPTDSSFLTSLPSAEPVSGTCWLTTAESKALGLASATGTETDAYIGFSASLPFTYDETSGVVGGTYDFVGAVEHEVTEALGRQLLSGELLNGTTSNYDLLDLMHYFSSGVRSLDSGTPGYASIDGGMTSLGQFNTGTGDGGDWASSIPNDSFDAVSTASVVNRVSDTDVQLMDALGWTTSTASAAEFKQVVLNISEDAYQGGAEYTVSIDGQQIGGTFLASASHADGEDQAVSMSVNLAPGEHQISVSFINDAYGGTPSNDRNLYVDSASYNGQDLPGAATPLYSNGTDTFSFDNTQTTISDQTVASCSARTDMSGITSSVAINVSEDAWQGDAHFSIAVDGQQNGVIYTATAVHSAGQSQKINLSSIAEDFQPHDIAVTFLNDAYGGTPDTDRNLYVNSIQFDGQDLPSGSAALFSAGTQHFTVVAPYGWTG